MKKKLLKGLSVAALSLGLLLSPPNVTFHNTNTAYAQEESKIEYSTHDWFFTRDEMKPLYEKEYEEGKRLEDPIILKDGKYIASCDGKTFEVPEKFVKNTLKHLEQMLEKGYAEYIFRIDSYHNHLFVPEEEHSKYSGLDDSKLIEEYAKDEKLGALYHNSEHLTAKDPKTGKIDPKAEDLIRKRSVLGWYDGRDVELTYPTENMPAKLKEANTASDPEGTHRVGNMTFKATKNGEFTINHEGKEIRIDLSFNNNQNYY